MDFGKLIRSFRFAFAGIGQVFRSEQNMRVHVLVALLVMGAGVFFQISTAEWLAVVLCIGSVMAAETINSAVERLADRVTDADDVLIGQAKDAAAGGVLLLAITSAAVGLIVFVPKLLALFPRSTS